MDLSNLLNLLIISIISHHIVSRNLILSEWFYDVGKSTIFSVMCSLPLQPTATYLPIKQRKK